MSHPRYWIDPWDGRRPVAVEHPNRFTGRFYAQQGYLEVTRTQYEDVLAKWEERNLTPDPAA